MSDRAPSVFGREPVLWLSAVQSGIALGVAFGLDLSAEQVGALVAFTGTVLSLIARSLVTPVTEL